MQGLLILNSLNELYKSGALTKEEFTKAKEKLVGLFKLLIEKIKQIVARAKEIIKGGIDKVLNYFELDVDVKVTTKVDFKV